MSTSKWEPIVWPDWEALIPPRELWVGPKDPLIHYFRWVWEYRAYLILLCDMQADDSVLELGCSHGRTALSLLDYLRAPGRYEGIDIMLQQIEFAQRNIHRAFPNFNFTLVDIHNSVYNPRGQVSADAFQFPFLDGSFDIVYAASLFSHLLPTATANYLRESRRVLRKGGHCLFSFFVLDYYRGAGTSAWEGYEFNHLLEGFPGVAVHNPDLPEQLVAYETTFLEHLAAEAGFRVKRLIPGYWSKTHNTALNEQDLLLLQAF